MLLIIFKEIYIIIYFKTLAQIFYFVYSSLYVCRGYYCLPRLQSLCVFSYFIMVVIIRAMIKKLINNCKKV